MQETITMASRGPRRAQVLTRLLVGEITAAEAVVLLSLSERQVWRLRSVLGRDGLAALVHGNRGRPPPRRLDPGDAARIVALARTTYDGANECHLAELFAHQPPVAEDVVLADLPNLPASHRTRGTFSVVDGVVGPSQTAR